VKKFVWRLQRLLEVKQKQEQILRQELVALTERSVAIRGRIMVLKTRLRSQLAELKMLPENRRMDAQRLYLEYVPVRDAEIRRLQEQWDVLETQRQQKLEDLMGTRKFRKGLEQLRLQAQTEYNNEMNRQEQKSLDECTHPGPGPKTNAGLYLTSGSGNTGE